jgi:hypothetical protein
VRVKAAYPHHKMLWQNIPDRTIGRFSIDDGVARIPSNQIRFYITGKGNKIVFIDWISESRASG